MQMQTTAKTSSVKPSVDRTAASGDYNWRIMISNALIITRREVIDSFRDWRILMPILILTFGFPYLATFVANEFFQFVTTYGADFAILAERSVPFLLMIVGFFPISISLVIALETFVGEKERRSLEPLLATPLTNTELYIGKTLSAMIPPLVASYGGMSVYAISLMNSDLQWQPQPMLIFQLFLLTTVQALVMITGSVVVSSQATSTRAANLLASFIIIPMTLAIQGESFVMFWAPDAESPYGIQALWMIIFGMLVVVVLFLRVGNSIFNREELLGRTIDEINLRNIAGRMWQSIRVVNDEQESAKNLFDWYWRGMPYALRRSRTAIVITLGMFVIALIGGLYVGQLDPFQLDLPGEIGELQESTMINYFMDTSVQTRAMAYVFINNMRVLALALLLGILSFGVMALITTPGVLVAAGYIFTQIAAAGLSLSIFYAAIIPHGIFEIPAAVLATALAFRLGSVITKPPVGQTVGGAWMGAFGDTFKVWFGLVIPLMIIGAFVEAFVTPRVLLAVLGG